MPTTNYSDDEIKEVYEQIEDLIRSIDDPQITWYGGWNAVVGVQETKDHLTTGNYGLGTKKIPKGRRLIEFSIAAIILSSEYAI